MLGIMCAATQWQSGLRTIREANIDNLVLRLVEKKATFIGLIFATDGARKAQIEGDSADDVWRRLHDEAGKANPKYFGFDGARARFLRLFPNGFESDDYAYQERDYKVDAKSKLDRTAPLSQAAAGSGFGEAVLAVFRATNLLFPLEKARLQDVLRGVGRRRVHSRRGPVCDGRDEAWVARDGTRAEAVRQCKMDGRDLPSISVVSRSAHVPQA
jgi:hypothetical protein